MRLLIFFGLLFGAGVIVSYDTGMVGAYIALGMLVLAIVLLVYWLFIEQHEDSTEKAKQNQSGKDEPPSPPSTIRCPNCGSPATVKGSQWECGYCGDFGNLK